MEVKDASNLFYFSTGSKDMFTRQTHNVTISTKARFTKKTKRNEPVNDIDDGTIVYISSSKAEKIQLIQSHISAFLYPSVITCQK